MAPNILTTPGHLAVSDLDAAKLASLKRHGYEWVSYQVQNGSSFRAYDLAPARAAGLSPGAWGVTYRKEDFFADGRRLGALAVELGAEHVQMDAEFCAKGTRATRGLRPIIEGIRDAGWNGAVHLNTLGAPVNPDVNDYAIDMQSFLETGGGIFPQAYFNADDGYRPSLCVRYWTRIGVPVERLNLMIGLHRSELDQPKPGVRLSGAEWVRPLREAGVKRNFSIFLAEYANEQDLVGLDPLSLVPPAPSTAETRTKIMAAAGAWETAYPDQPRARVTVIRRIASADNTNLKWREIVDELVALLDRAGIAR